MKSISRSTLFVVLLSCTSVNAQNLNSLYNISNPSPNVFDFAEMDLNTGNLSVLQTLPITVISTSASACIDVPRATYHFCDGTTIYSLDANNVSPMQTIVPPMPTSAEFLTIEYDACDSTFIGIVNDPPTSIEIVKFDPVTNQITPILALPAMTYFLGGTQADFDPNTRIFYLQTASGLIGVNVDAGSYVYNTPITNLPNFLGVGHFAYDCQSQRLIGTDVGTSPQGHYGKFICELDPSTGLISLITTTPTAVGLWKPSLGSSTIDLSTDMFYWSGSGGIIVGGNSVSGNIPYSQQSSSTELMLIEHFSGCACGMPTSIATNTNSGFTLFPNPTQGAVTLSGVTPNTSIAVYSVTGKLAHSELSSGTVHQMDISKLSSGSYFLVVDGAVSPLVVQ